MKIAIISDTHDNLVNIKKIVAFLNKEKIKLILHCGDVCSAFTLQEGFKDFPGEIKIALGNADFDFDLGNIPEVGEVELKNKNIAFAHYPEKARQLAETEKYDLVFHGHTHKPWEEKVGECRLVNPGTAGGIFYKATFAVYDSGKDKLELKILENL